MASVNTLNFLPRVFRTLTNRRFLGATLDHLISDASNLPLNGYIGRTFAPTYKLGDNYVPEAPGARAHYQLEPSVVIKNENGDIEFNTGYIDLLRNITNNGGITTNQQRLFSSETYSFDGHFDYDKFVNYFNYYWLPSGPTSVKLYSNQAPYNADYIVNRNTSVGGYTFTGIGFQPNTQLTLVRGGTYTFQVNQPGNKFWIQRSPGVNGVDANVNTLSTREVYGVTNNGDDSGTVTFRVPLYNAQDFYINMPITASVDSAVTFNYTDIQNRLLSDFIAEFPDGLDGINNQLQNKNFVFINYSLDTADWTTASVPSEYTSLDVASIRPGDVIPASTRVSAWKIDLIAVDEIESDYIIQISPQTPVVARQKVFITSGKTYASQEYWLNDNLIYKTVPAITANKDYLYYQDSSNPGFVGVIKLIDNITTSINVDKDIVGQVGYTSPNGVIFTNGLKVQFDSLVTPSSYYKFEYSNYSSWLTAVEYSGAIVTGDNTGASAANNGEVIGEWNGATGYRIREWYVEGVGTSITLVPVGQITVPEDFSQYIETQADYITINRGSQDRNAWSRSNRWFHKDVISATALYNKTTEEYGPNLPGRRPIIEFEPDLQLFNYSKKAKNVVDLITFTNTDAFGVTLPATRVEGQTSAIIDGVTLEPGHRVVFANDYDLNVKNKIWVVTVIENLAGENYINLISADDNPVQTGEGVLVTNGDHIGRTYRFNGSDWFECQAKTALNQMPLFDLVDKDGYSFADTTVYPESTFLTTGGNKIFNYYPGTGSNNDTLLGFPLRYQNFNNIGDIVFKNYYDEDTFTYTTDMATGTKTTLSCGTGYLVKNNNLTSQTYLNAWIKNKEPSKQYQLFTKFFDGRVILVTDPRTTNTTGSFAFVQLDILPASNGTIPNLKVYKNNTLLVNGTDYVLTTYGVYNIVVFYTTPAIGDKLDVAVYSDTVSKLSFYEVPTNLDQNPLNEKFSTIALGQIRTHYNKLIENTSASNRPSHDDYLKANGGTLSQHSAPLVYAMTFLNDPQVNFVNGLDLAKKEYSRFKNKFINLCVALSGLDYNDPISGVDAILQNINSVKNNTFPWYYSDMVPQGGNYTTITYNVLNVRQTNYEINSIFNPLQLSNRAVLIWHNGTQLTLGNDYTFSSTVPAVIFTKTFAVGDTITIRDYFNTDGNFIPETPSKLGLYPKSEPTIYEDTTYQTPTQVIRGHDGSLTPVFGDFRDTYLLELEKRIYNNIKADYTKNIINLYDILPGRFRSTEYSRDEFIQVLSKNFLQWTGSNNVDYTSNDWFDANNSWTWNYDQFTDSVDNKPLQGSWRAIYQYWYDTDQPNLAPWQMLGLGFKPSWWETRYGPAPYTSGNFTLWEDLEAGYIWNDGAPYYDSRFARPGLINFIPVDSAGNLLSPADTNIVKQYNISTAGNSFVVGQQGPVETAWRRSSDYPFAVQMALAMCKPASYFSTQYDTSRFYVNDVSMQFTDANNQKITPLLLSVNGDATTGTVLRTSGYINWIADAIKNIGIDPVAKISGYLSNLEIKLNYKVGGFTDKNMLTVTAEQTAPGTTRAGVIIPDSNYAVYLNKSVPTATVTYSAVIVQKTIGGYTVTGYDTSNPFFTTLPSVQNSNAELVTVNDVTVRLFLNSQKQPTAVPYGTTFKTVQELSDFLVSYERYLNTVGFSFTEFDPDLQEPRNFRTSVKEFLAWGQQGWENGTIIVLNPTANSIILQSIGSVVDEVANTSTSGKILDQNFVPIKSANFNIVRADSPNGNAFKITALDSTGICLARLHLVQYEHVLIFDNQSDFGDIIYIPSQGVRQYRLKLSGNKTGQFTGALNAPGYIYSTAQVNDWSAGVDYQVGDIVTFNNNYYTALSTIPATTKFDITNWAQIQEQDIKTGLLPSFGLQAQQFDSIYDVDHPPSNESLQLFSAGLIGFRPRNYLTDLGISIPNQTKFYQGYIKEKGSLNSITALTKANFNNVTGQIELFEEWGFKVGQYGDLDRNQFSEFVLDQSTFTTNPVAFTSNATYSTGNIIVNLNGNAVAKGNASLGLYSNVYNSNNLSSTVTTLYNNRADKFFIEDLPSAGPVYLGDTDLSIFNINTYFDSPDVKVGSKIWTAVDTTGDWNVYRVTETAITATQLTYTLDSYAQLQFNGTHSFVAGDLFLLKGFNVEYFNNAILKNFNTNYDSVYKVINVVNSTTVTIQIHSTSTLNNLIATSPVLSTGTTYKLVSMKISSVQNIDSITPPNNWINADRVWVANAVGTTGWGVYEYNKAYPNNEQSGNLVLSTSANDLFGSRILSTSNYFYISNPGEKRIQVFNGNIGSTYTANTTLSNADAKFGQVFDVQGNLLVVASTNYINVYRHNDSTTINTVSMPWVANAFPTSGTPWTANTVVAYNTQISYSGNTYIVKGNVYGSAFTNSTVQANVVQGNVIPVNSIVTHNSNVYITTGNVCPGNVVLQQSNVEAAFNTISSNLRKIDLASGNITLLQTINTTANVVGNVSSISVSGDKNWIYVGGNSRVLAYSTVTTNPLLANVTYQLVSANTGATSLGSNVKTNYDGTVVFATTPLATDTYTQNGNVSYYTRVGNLLMTYANTSISSHNKNINALFGTSIDIDSTASNLFIGAPGSTASGHTRGAVEHYVYNGTGYVYVDTLLPPAIEFTTPGEHATQFGTSISISGKAKTVAIGAIGGYTNETTNFANGTVVNNTITNSGSVYIFEPLIDLTKNTFTYSFTQEIETGVNDVVATGDQFGLSVHVKRDNKLILVGAPGTNSSAGKVYTFNNPNSVTTWVLTRSELPKVDITSVNRTFLYNKSTNNILATIDVIDPAKGKILTSVDKDIDYKVQYDPAVYNAGTVDTREDYHWGPEQVGRIWWNLDTVRYIDYEQDALIYRLNHWGDTFPGSSIDVYEWVESTVLPSQFVISGASGVPLHADDSAYSTYGYVDQSGNIRLKYYFWVSSRDEANTFAGKQNSINAIVSAIENPQNQNIPYVNVLRDDTVALYNIKNLLVGQNSVLHLGSRSGEAGLVHTEYALVQEKSANSQIPDNILSKLIDSLAGEDAAGNPVPDPALPPSQMYGIEIRVQEDKVGSAQTMFVNRASALANYLSLVNKTLLAYPVTQRKVLTKLNSGELAPSVKSGAYRADLVVGSLVERDYIDTSLLAVNDSILITSDVTQLGKWAIYTWTGSAWELARVQSYKTNLYWSAADWYDASFDPTTTVNITVPDTLEFGKLALQADTYIKVLNAGNDKFAIYYINSALERVTVGLESGTIQISTDTIPSNELRQILQSMQSDIFVDDLAQNFNEIFFAMIKFALTEQKNIDWAFKTSFISATQFIRKLEQFPSYISDNQDFYQTYIDEVKPYRTILREFNINYQRNDQFSGDITDFDLAPYWDSNINVYRSPSGEQSYDNELLTNRVYQDWKNNYTYSVVDVTVGEGGSGYILPPQIIITGGGGTGANAVAQINEFGNVANITIVNPGSGYTSTPSIVIRGTGSDAVATAVLRNVYDSNDTGHNVVRSIKTNIKFDRVTYDWKKFTSDASDTGNSYSFASGLTSSNALVMWSEVTASQVLAPFTYINNNDTLWQVTNLPVTINSSADFPIANVTTISVANLKTANDRIVAYYGNIDLSATAHGIDYPGVIVDGSNYFAYDTISSWSANTTAVLGTEISYSGNVYTVTGNIYGVAFTDAGVQANVTQVDAAKIDAIISSRFSDNLGIDAGNIYVDGGKYVDTFSSHAPEELVPGRVYDSLNLQVFGNATPGTNDYAFRLFDNMSQQHKFYRISNTNTTTLAQDLLITDSLISVTDATRLPNPNRVLGTPGEIFINGEKIVYYRNYSHETLTPWASNTVINVDSLISFNGQYYVTTGNVFGINTEWAPNTVFATNSYVYHSGNTYHITGNVNAPAFSDIVANTALVYNNENSGFATITSFITPIGSSLNTLGQIRRATDGTAPNSNVAGVLVHTAGTRVVDTSALQALPVASASNVVIAATKTVTVTANVTLNLHLSGTISANVGDFLLKKQTSTTVANLRILGNVVNSSNVAAILISGTLAGTTSNTTAVVNRITGVVTATAPGILLHNPLGQVNTSGNVTITANTVVTQSNIWYGNINSRFYGNTLSNSTTYEATFLKASPGFLP